MKKKFLCMLLVMGLALAISGTTQAVSLRNGPGIFKTFNHEIGTTYFGGEAGDLHFLSGGLEVATEEHGTITHGVGDRLISDLVAVRPGGLEDGEDSFGIFNITSIWEGDILPVDSRFGDGSDLTDLGNDITSAAGGLYWFEGIDNGRGDEYLRGLFFGAHDVLVEVIVPDKEYKIWSEDGEFVIYEVLDDPAYNPALLDVATRPTARVTTDEFPGWFDPIGDTLQAKGDIIYQRFQADLADIPNSIFDGNTEVVLTVNEGAWNPAPANDAFLDWWEAPDGTMADVWQSWNIGDPYVLSNGWTGSEDSARFHIVPEPVTMLGMFMGIGGLSGYIRKRQKGLSLA